MHLASDYIHPYKDTGGRSAHCRVRIYLPEDVLDSPVVICSELPNNPGGSITNSAEVIAAEVIRVETAPYLEETRAWIGEPIWKQLDRTSVEVLVGGKV